MTVLRKSMGNAQTTKHLCSVCMKETESRCPNCKLGYYCTKVCQRKEWHMHKQVCAKVTEQMRTTANEAIEKMLIGCPVLYSLLVAYQRIHTCSFRVDLFDEIPGVDYDEVEITVSILPCENGATPGRLVLLQRYGPSFHNDLGEVRHLYTVISLPTTGLSHSPEHEFGLKDLEAYGLTGRDWICWYPLLGKAEIRARKDRSLLKTIEVPNNPELRDALASALRDMRRK